MLKIGLTGGIGSGKTMVARIFQSLGIPVYFADERARYLMNHDISIRENLVKNFGEDTYINGQLNRKFLSDIVFRDPLKLELLNALTHPATIEDANQWMNKQKAPYVIKEAALLFESGSVAHLDAVIGVYSPQPLRIQRVMHRDHISEEEVKKRMSRQINEEIKMRLCDYVLINDEQQMLLPQVIRLHERLLSESN